MISRSTMATWRAVLVGVGLSLGGCGFQPLYGSAGNGVAGPAEAGLAQISVALMPERSGQLLREALQDRLERGGTGVAVRYDLTIAYAVSADGLAIQPDSSISRVRFIGAASWSLTAQDPQRRTLTSGTARAMDAHDVINSQLFAADLDSEVVQRRLAGAVAEQITLQLASWFDKQAGL